MALCALATVGMLAVSCGKDQPKGGEGQKPDQPEQPKVDESLFVSDIYVLKAADFAKMGDLLSVIKEACDTKGWKLGKETTNYVSFQKELDKAQPFQMLQYIFKPKSGSPFIAAGAAYKLGSDQPATLNAILKQVGLEGAQDVTIGDNPKLNGKVVTKDGVQFLLYCEPNPDNQYDAYWMEIAPAQASSAKVFAKRF